MQQTAPSPPLTSPELKSKLIDESKTSNEELNTSSQESLKFALPTEFPQVETNTNASYIDSTPIIADLIPPLFPTHSSSSLINEQDDTKYSTPLSTMPVQLPGEPSSHELFSNDFPILPSILPHSPSLPPLPSSPTFSSKSSTSASASTSSSIPTLPSSKSTPLSSTAKTSIPHHASIEILPMPSMNASLDSATFYFSDTPESDPPPFITKKWKSFAKLFGEYESEALMGTFPCIMQKQDSWSGRLYYTPEHLCFYGRRNKKIAKVAIAWTDVIRMQLKPTSITDELHGTLSKDKYAIHTMSLHSKYIFIPPYNSETVFSDLTNVWNGALKLMKKPILPTFPSPKEPQIESTECDVPEKIKRSSSQSSLTPSTTLDVLDLSPLSVNPSPFSVFETTPMSLSTTSSSSLSLQTTPSHTTPSGFSVMTYTGMTTPSMVNPLTISFSSAASTSPSPYPSKPLSAGQALSETKPEASQRRNSISFETPALPLPNSSSSSSSIFPQVPLAPPSSASEVTTLSSSRALMNETTVLLDGPSSEPDSSQSVSPSTSVFPTSLPLVASPTLEIDTLQVMECEKTWMQETSSSSTQSTLKSSSTSSSATSVSRTTISQQTDVPSFVYPITCSCSSHLKHIVFQQILPLDLDTFWNAMYSSSNPWLFQEAHAARDTMDMTLQPWQHKTRVLKYRVMYSLPFKGKSFADCSETQTVIVKDKFHFVVETTIESPGVPFGDSFSPYTKVCALQLGPQQLFLTSSLKVEFARKLFLESKIEAGAVSNSVKFWKQVASKLKQFPPPPPPSTPPLSSSLPPPSSSSSFSSSSSSSSPPLPSLPSSNPTLPSPTSLTSNTPSSRELLSAHSSSSNMKPKNSSSTRSSLSPLSSSSRLSAFTSRFSWFHFTFSIPSLFFIIFRKFMDYILFLLSIVSFLSPFRLKSLVSFIPVPFFSTSKSSVSSSSSSSTSSPSSGLTLPSWILFLTLFLAILNATYLTYLLHRASKLHSNFLFTLFPSSSYSPSSIPMSSTYTTVHPAMAQWLNSLSQRLMHLQNEIHEAQTLLAKQQG